MVSRTCLPGPAHLLLSPLICHHSCLLFSRTWAKLLRTSALPSHHKSHSPFLKQTPSSCSDCLLCLSPLHHPLALFLSRLLQEALLSLASALSSAPRMAAPPGTMEPNIQSSNPRPVPHICVSAMTQ